MKRGLAGYPLAGRWTKQSTDSRAASSIRPRHSTTSASTTTANALTCADALPPDCCKIAPCPRVAVLSDLPLYPRVTSSPRKGSQRRQALGGWWPRTRRHLITPEGIATRDRSESAPGPGSHLITPEGIATLVPPVRPANALIGSPHHPGRDRNSLVTCSNANGRLGHLITPEGIATCEHRRARVAAGRRHLITPEGIATRSSATRCQSRTRHLITPEGIATSRADL